MFSEFLKKEMIKKLEEIGRLFLKRHLVLKGFGRRKNKKNQALFLWKKCPNIMMEEYSFLVT